MRPTRREFLTCALAGAAAMGTSFFVPRRVRAGNGPPIKHLVILYGYGGIRWSASFDGQTAVTLNPWGNLTWSPSALGLLDPNAKEPAFATSRLMVQKPLFYDDTQAWPQVLAYLSQSNNYNLTRSALSSAWGNVKLPNYLDMVGAGDAAIVRVTNNINGPADTDHGSASHTLATCYPDGLTGLTTAIQDALRRQVGAATYDALPTVPAVHLGGWGFDLGVGSFASSRPLTLADYGGVVSWPTSDPGNTVSAWGKKAELALDTAFQASRNSLAGQDVANLINDKAHEHYVGQLVDPALRLTDPMSATAQLGTLMTGGPVPSALSGAPLTNAMLAELFGLSSTATPAGDILFDCFASRQATTSPTWGLGSNQEGLVGAQVVRLLQKGAPIVSCAYGNYDSHATEVHGTSATHDSCVSHLVALGRTLAALSFALKWVADPADPTKSLWDSTVVVLTSEFGRSFQSTDGFYSQADGGGSEHGDFCGWPVLGGPVSAAGAGGKLFDDGMKGRLTHQNRVFTTLMKGMGIDDTNSTYLSYSDFAPLSGLIQGV